MARKDVVPCFGKISCVCSDKGQRGLNQHDTEHLKCNLVPGCCQKSNTSSLPPAPSEFALSTDLHNFSPTYSMCVQVNEPRNKEIGGEALEIKTTISYNRLSRDSCNLTSPYGDVKGTFLVLSSW